MANIKQEIVLNAQINLELTTAEAEALAELTKLGANSLIDYAPKIAEEGFEQGLDSLVNSINQQLPAILKNIEKAKKDLEL